MAEREALEQRLREAIDTGQIVPHYQPVVDLPERRVRGVELLSRWQTRSAAGCRPRSSSRWPRTAG